MSAKDWIPENYVPQTIDAAVATAKNLPSDAVHTVKDRLVLSKKLSRRGNC